MPTSEATPESGAAVAAGLGSLARFGAYRLGAGSGTGFYRRIGLAIEGV